MGDTPRAEMGERRGSLGGRAARYRAVGTFTVAIYCLLKVAQSETTVHRHPRSIGSRGEGYGIMTYEVEETPIDTAARQILFRSLYPYTIHVLDTP